MALRGCLATGDPIRDFSSTPYTTSNTTIQAAEVTAGDGDALVWGGGNNGLGVITGPTGYTDSATDVAWDAGTSYMRLAVKLGATAGGTSTVDGTTAAGASSTPFWQR